MFSLLVSILILTSSAAEKSVDAGDIEQVNTLKEVDAKYQKSKSIIMDVQKTDRIAALEQTKSAAGKIWIRKGKFRLELETKDESKDKSTIVADGQHLWMVTPPPKEFKGAKTQVVKVPMNTDRARQQGLLQLLTEGGVLKYFKVTGTSVERGRVTYFLSPDKKSVEFRRAQVVIDTEAKKILSLKYWDSLDNETNYEFSKVSFNGSVADSLLKYSPPKDADVITNI
ncbi:MAG: outer membrane lipoprotein carrier protein LolA [Bdellovibrionales bacterium]|nr:outer membrane lipoprotein carrier protein LolA [Bdellovibrionales bacterium]